MKFQPPTSVRFSAACRSLLTGWCVAMFLSRRVFGYLVFLGLVTICVLMLWYRASLIPLRLNGGIRMERSSLRKLDSSFLVDTPGCRIPNLNVKSPEVLEFVYDYPEVTCDGLPPLVRSDNKVVFLDRAKAGHYGVNPTALDCCTRALWLRQANFTLPEDKKRLASFRLPPGGDAKVGDVVEYADECTPFEDDDVARVRHEFVRVECRAGSRDVYRDFVGFVRPTATPVPAVPEPERKLSVLLLGADNLSRLNLIRSMPRVAALLDRLGGVTMLGYNKVDDYSYVNLVPLLSGLPSRLMEKDCLFGNSVFFDPCPWIWKRFRRRGYRTALMEDTPSLGLFHFHSPGFAKQPVDVDSRALLLAAERELPRPRAKNTSPVCLGPRFQIQGLFDFALKFVRATSTPFFQYVWGTSLTHDYLNQAQIADVVYESFIEELENTGALNHTALVFLSDHGNRVGPIVTTYQGHVEDRLPVLNFVLPQWLHQRYPLASATLRANAHRLVTVMDVHETLLHFTDLTSLEEGSLRAAAEDVRQRTLRAGKPPHAVSLFLPVPDTRTCEQAAVVPHFCACVHLTPVAVDHPQVVQAARLVVDTVNAALAPHPLCSPLALHAVRDARRGVPSSLMHQKSAPERVREQEFLVTVETKPGGALLEGTVRHLLAENLMRMAGRVTRLNKYGNSSWCISTRELLLYCHCVLPQPK